ncbi:MAG: hypothetical protein LQ346_004629 [Caloplaca aetnensis]|nr:MAG: hypothetical protein LQ346_004629 [Caloplaca aetnensis]
MTEDDIYRTSTQYRLWSFTPETLASLRATTNAAAAAGVKDAYHSPKWDDAPGEGHGAPQVDVDCLTVEEEQKIIGYYCLQTLELVDFCEYPTKVKVRREYCCNGVARILTVLSCSQATAVQYLKRFYLTNSPMTYHPKGIMPTAVYMAMKSEDNFHYVKTFAAQLPKITTEDILAPEFLLTQGLRFTFDVRHPFNGLEGGFMELLAIANGKGQGGPLVNKTPKEVREEMMAISPVPGSGKATNAKDLVLRIQKAHAIAKELLKTSALLTDAYFLYTPSQIWLSTLMLADEALARFYIDSKLPAMSEMKLKLLATLERCAEMLRESPIAHPDKEEKKELKRIDKKLVQCQNPRKMDLVGINEAQKRDPDRNGGDGLDESVAAKRKLERQKSMKESDDLFGPAIPDRKT